MKLSDYVAQFIGHLVDHVFVVTGGNAVHLIDSLGQCGVKYVPVAHEQAGAMAADAYSRITGFGVAMSTSGPGATNMLTGCACAYYDSVPVLFITGQVPTSQLRGYSESRQVGFQETDVVSIFRPVTKYAVIVSDPKRIRFHLEQAIYLARHGRQGPVLVDICDDVQRAEIQPDELESFTPSPLDTEPSGIFARDMELQAKFAQIRRMKEMIGASERPVLILGAGARNPHIIEKLGIPFTFTWGAFDLISHDHPLFVGGFGVTSGRVGNFAVQNADLIVAVGTRLDTHETGSTYATFAPKAKKIIIDIDPAEQAKYAQRGMDALLITGDTGTIFGFVDKISPRDRKPWLDRIRAWKERYPVCTEDCRAQKNHVNPYVFMEELSRQAPDATITTDVGNHLVWTMQGLKVSRQRIISDWNNSAMGYALPAAMGIAFTGRQVICITGDGTIQMNIQELATIERHNLPVKIFILNNHGYGMIQGTQDAWLGGRHHASNRYYGLPDVNFERIAWAYGIRSRYIRTHKDLDRIGEVLRMEGPVLCNVEVNPGEQAIPKLLFGRPLEDLHPLLPRDELEENMK